MGELVMRRANGLQNVWLCACASILALKRPAARGGELTTKRVKQEPAMSLDEKIAFFKNKVEASSGDEWVDTLEEFKQSISPKESNAPTTPTIINNSHLTTLTLVGCAHDWVGAT